MFTDGFLINGEHSFAGYGLNVKKRQLGFPKKNSIRKTVPLMNGYYDFTKINGDVSWGERSLSYTFDIIGETPEEVEAECSRILNWVGNAHDVDIYDDTMAGYHLHGSFDSATPSESEDGEHTELAVAFVCYPFKIADDYTKVTSKGNFSLDYVGQPVLLYVEAAKATDITVGGYAATISEGVTELPMLLERGKTLVSADETVTFKWIAEVL